MTDPKDHFNEAEAELLYNICGSELEKVDGVLEAIENANLENTTIHDEAMNRRTVLAKLRGYLQSVEGWDTDCAYRYIPEDDPINDIID